MFKYYYSTLYNKYSKLKKVKYSEYFFFFFGTKYSKFFLQGEGVYNTSKHFGTHFILIE
jgi:hypothetical protein